VRTRTCLCRCANEKVVLTGENSLICRLNDTRLQRSQSQVRLDPPTLHPPSTLTSPPLVHTLTSLPPPHTYRCHDVSDRNWTGLAKRVEYKFARKIYGRSSRAFCVIVECENVTGDFSFVTKEGCSHSRKIIQSAAISVPTRGDDA
jgi:hypothetical protein